MGNFLLDLRYSLRTMWSQPGFVIVAILSLAVGIGANTAIFSVYSSIFQPDQGVREPGRIVQVNGSDYRDFQGSFPEYLDYRAATTGVFEDLMAYAPMIGLFDLGEHSEMVFFETVTGNYFDLLGVEPVLGRFFDAAEDDVPGAEPTVVLPYHTWHDSFGGDPGIIGRTIRVNTHALTVIGVAPREFPGMYPFTVAFWAPLSQIGLFDPDGDALLQRRGQGDTVWMKGRLRDGVTLAQAGVALEAVRAGLAEQYPEIYQGWRGPSLLPAKDIVIIPEFDRPIRLLSFFLMGLVGLVIVIACINLAGILLARASARRREIGIRMALGAGRGRLVRQMLTESILLALIGGGVGVFIAAGLIRLLVAFQPPIGLTISLDLGLHAGALLFALLLSVGTGIVFGLLPARQATHPDIVQALKGMVEAGRPSGRGTSRLRMRSLLVVAQVAVSVVLLLGAGLLVRSLTRVNSFDPGFDLRQGALFDILFKFSTYDREGALATLQRIEEDLAALPGVETVGLAGSLPLNLGSDNAYVYPLDSTHPAAEAGAFIGLASAGTGFFPAMGIPLLRGRSFSGADQVGAPLTAVVNETFAERFWPGQDPIGRQFTNRDRSRVYTIVGVAADGRYVTLGEEQRPYYWTSLLQADTINQVSFVVRSAVPSGPILGLVQRELRTIDPDLPLFNLRTVTQYRSLMLFLPRLVGGLASVLGALALLLAMTGLYGVISFDAARRTREVGIRMALGARRGDVLALILEGGIKLVLIGLVIGIPVAGLAAQGLTALLFGITPLDPVTFVGVPLLLLGITLAATLTPARRAAAVQPVEALRHQ